MKTDALSVRQMAVCAFVGGLAPAAAGAGYGWQGALLAVPVILLAGWALTALAPRWRSIENKWTGRTLGVLYALWAAALLARGLARCAGRVLAAGGGDVRHAPWLIALLALPLLWMARGKPAAFFRAAEIFYLAVALTGAALLVWSAFKMEWRYLLLPAEDLGGGFWAALEAGGTFLFVLPYVNRVKASQKNAGRAMVWLAALAGATVLMSLAAVGVLSPAVAGRTGQPFFLMTAVLGRGVRVEGLAGALWLLADLACLGLLARSWQRRGTDKSWLPPLAVALGAVCAALDLPSLLPPAVWGGGCAVLALATVLILLCAGAAGGTQKDNSTGNP